MVSGIEGSLVSGEPVSGAGYFSPHCTTISASSFTSDVIELET